MPQNSFEQLKLSKKFGGGSQRPPPQVGNSACFASLGRSSEIFRLFYFFLSTCLIHVLTPIIKILAQLRYYIVIVIHSHKSLEIEAYIS